jgi:hypothetical protein
VGNNDPIFLAMKPRQCTIYRNPLSAHKWTIENFLWTEEKQSSSSLNHGVDYFFDLSAVRAYLEKHNKHRNEDVFDVDAQPAVDPTAIVHSAVVHSGDRDRAVKGKGHSNMMIVESDNYTEYIDDSDDECLDNLSLDRVNPTPAYVDISLSNTLNNSAFDSNAFDKRIRSGVCVTSTSTSALPGLTSLHISTEGCSAWARAMSLGPQTLDLTFPDSSSSSEAQQQSSVEVVEVMEVVDVLEMTDEEWRLQTFGFAESPKAAKEEGNKENKGNEGGSEEGSESSVEGDRVNEKEEVHRLGQQKDVLTPSRDAASDRVTIDLNLIADTDIDVAVAVELEAEAEIDVEVDVDGNVEVLGVPVIDTESSPVKDTSKSSTNNSNSSKSSGSAVKSKSNSTGTSSSAIKDSNRSCDSAYYTDPSPEEQERVRAQEQSDLASRRLAKRLSRGYFTLHESRTDTV